MSKEHPVVVVTGSSGAGTTTVMHAVKNIFWRERWNACIIEGDSFHKYNRVEMKREMEMAQLTNKNFSHFGPEANLFDSIGSLFREYGESGTGKRRYYLHTDEEAAEYEQVSGQFTQWEDVPLNTDLLFYEGLHGGIPEALSYTDLSIGVVPCVNLEWIQKIHRDTNVRGYEVDCVTDRILERMPDYINHITPQFSWTDINFQRVPTVDTSNPFLARDIPTPGESFVIVRVRDTKQFDVDFPMLLNMVQGSFMSRPNTLVIPGDKMGFVMELMLTPILSKLISG